MPVLSKPKHEAMEIGLARGVSADQAYEAAGFKPDRGNAARLASNGSIQARVAELLEEAARKTTNAISFEAIDLFRRLEQDIADAKAAGDHKAAITGRITMLECFGYKDSPTLTHEHVKGAPLKPEEAAAVENNQTSVVRFTKTLQELRKRSDGK